MLETPVLLITFNRPDHTKRVLGRILASNPKKIFVSADGPRRTNAEDPLRCAAVRRCIESVPKGIEVQTLYHEENLGCKKSVVLALKWFFGRNDSGIVLEDDTLPDLSFFGFCEAALQKYASEERVMLVSGHNPLGSIKTGTDAVFSKYPYIWGWASWKRAWKNYKPEISREELDESEGQVRRWLRSRHAALFWKEAFRDVARGCDTWDYQLCYSMCIRRSLAVVSSKNLVANIGFGEDAVHTKNVTDTRQNTPVFTAPKVPQFPASIDPDPVFEKAVVREIYFRDDVTALGLLKKYLRPIVRAVRSSSIRKEKAIRR